jgi:hypothetical protein
MKIKSFDEFDELNEKKKEDHKHEYGCAMVYFDFPEMSDIHDMIDKDDIYIDDEDDSFGLEKKPHVTLLYGLLEDVKDDEIFDICMKHEIGEIELKKISIFKSEKYDVLKFDAYNDELHTINKELSALPNENSYPEYHPHCTIAYLKKDVSDKYTEKLKDNEYVVTPKKIVYSKPSGEEVAKKVE